MNNKYWILLPSYHGKPQRVQGFDIESAIDNWVVLADAHSAMELMSDDCPTGVYAMSDEAYQRLNIEGQQWTNEILDQDPEVNRLMITRNYQPVYEVLEWDENEIWE